MILGVERTLAILNITIIAAAIMATMNLLFLAIGVSTHWFLRWTSRADPFLIRIYARYGNQGRIYEPWPKLSQHRNLRPKGFDPDLLL